MSNSIVFGGEALQESDASLDLTVRCVAPSDLTIVDLRFAACYGDDPAVVVLRRVTVGEKSMEPSDSGEVLNSGEVLRFLGSLGCIEKDTNIYFSFENVWRPLNVSVVLLGRPAEDECG